MYKTNGFKDDWYRHWFGPEYLKVYNHRDQKDAEALITLFFKSARPTVDQLFLDLACGNGRHAHLLARKGMNVIGVDLSMPLLTNARSVEQGNNVPLFIQADMRLLPLKTKFDGVLSLFTSFGYFRQEEDNERVLAEIARVLKSSGVYLLDYMNSSFVAKNLVKESRRRVDDIEVYEKRYIHQKRVFKDIVLYQNRQRKEFHESVRLYSMEELTRLLQKAGFWIEKSFGNYQAEPYSESSERMILFCRKNG